MKKVILISLITIICYQGFSQQLFYMNSEISEDRAYSAIINTALKQEELILRVKDYLVSEKLIDSTEEITIYDENIFEYKVGFGFKHGQYLTKGLWGAPQVAPPVTLYFDVFILLNNLGQMKITITNFYSKVIAFVDEDGYLNCLKGGKGNGKEWGDANIIYPADKAVSDEYGLILSTETGVGKALILFAGGLELYNKTVRGEFRKKTKEQFEIYENAIKNGSSEVITRDRLPSLKVIGGIAKYWPDQVDKIIGDKLVIGVNQHRWEHFFEPVFDYFFKEISDNISGQIDQIALDGKVKYENVDGKILPTDPKLRKKWKRQNIVF
ncbi:MAG TPA: hypothetical protein PLH70_03380 [Bacteroidales bacterium]|nr:hypothetical protein [Bacteroidales bacterium]HOH22143.1 hypothetical protein [Bacteroidales bacterium]HPZ03396.1 hypothetical protein [Bacteroidales bacterium]HQB74825.1 hypothetical protein [Bacteroidales bacterium]